MRRVTPNAHQISVSAPCATRDFQTVRRPARRCLSPRAGTRHVDYTKTGNANAPYTRQPVRNGRYGSMKWRRSSLRGRQHAQTFQHGSLAGAAGGNRKQNQRAASGNARTRQRSTRQPVMRPPRRSLVTHTRRRAQRTKFVEPKAATNRSRSYTRHVTTRVACA